MNTFLYPCKSYLGLRGVYEPPPYGERNLPLGRNPLGFLLVELIPGLLVLFAPT